MFNHVEIEVPRLSRKTIDGVRYYDTPSGKKLVSITSVISHYNREIFVNWRKRVGNEEANKVTKQSTSRGTDTHTLIEHYLKNEDLPTVQPLSDMLFKIAKGDLKNIDNIHGLETPLYSEFLGIAGTVDCIAEYNNELAIIDFKTSKKPKKREWIEGYFVQCAAYACMLYELTGLTVKKFVIIMTCENGECEVYEEYDKAKYIKLLTKYIREFVEFQLHDTNA
jgi:CRISPR/Cas system-associated exonuclease Cas4 (RecB family)